MSDFWDNLQAGMEHAIETMGEDFTVGGTTGDTTYQGIVDPLETEVSDSAGGEKQIVSGEVMVSETSAAAIEDGAAVTVRGMPALVNSRRDDGGGVFLQLAGRNRWEGEGLP